MATEQLKTELIETVAARIRNRLEPARSRDPERFVRQFYAQVAPADLLRHTAEDLYGAALALWMFGARRKPGEARVRVYNPRVDEHGWHSGHTILEIVTDDMPWLVDSVTAYLNRDEAEVHLVIHPIVQVQRAVDGRLEQVFDGANGHPGVLRESLMHIQVSEQPVERHERLRLGVERVVADIRAAVEDWEAMRDRCLELADEVQQQAADDDAETSEFLRWLLDDHFTFLGYREYRFEGDNAFVLPESGLGVLRDELASVFDGMITGGRRPEEIDSEPIRITKANRRSTIHRPVHMDTIGIKRVDASGRAVGERLFMGLFTSAAYADNPRAIPLLRRKFENVIARAAFEPASHDAKSLQHILETYPRDELHQISEEQLFETALGILHLQERQRIALFARVDPYERFASCLVYVPRDRYDTELRLRFQDILAEAYRGTVKAFYTHMTDAPLARLHFIVKTTPGKLPEVDPVVVERRLVEAGRSWNDRLREALIEARGEERGLRAMRRFGTAFPPAYRDLFSATVAVRDLERVEEAVETGDLALYLYRPIEARADEVRFKMYACGRAAPLSDVLPKLENMGLVVRGETPFRLRPADFALPVWIREFEMETRDGGTIDLALVRDRFHEAFRLVWRGEMENDGFNQLVLRAGLSAREVTILRAYCKFLLQAQIPFSQVYMEQTLARNAEIARLLVQLFLACFDPEDGGDRDARADALRERIETALEGVSNLDEDRIIRAFRQVIHATLRTNFFQLDAQGKTKGYLSFKLDSRAIRGLPQPRPLCEIFVYAPGMEGVHLRGGRVARGGIRWSDRREDFRTEILGLMKAQMVKNAVIVPVGSKGGFVVKRPPSETGAPAREEVLECYRTLMRGMLDLTDNLDGDRVVPPASVVRRDDDDPYLVVAADKGTATFSDTANAMAADYGYWLDDAFASGGSAGYDHKRMAITARGGWESVKRHFREMGKDIQSEDFTVVGVGDMAGDVFGNGMLLSRHIRLVAAFNHMHIFVDPDPDAATSFEERRRLFDLPGSSWDDYDRSRISAGGGVFARSLKSIPVSPRMRELFRLSGDVATPHELIHAILQADVELLWLGGIGTYVRAAQETDRAVGDRANDALRIEAGQLRARVVGEGANLGLTQRARIEYALAGGRINTDSIDNSAGVDCSDHEVNIKILLGESERAGDLTRKQRNELLEQMTDEVAELVLRDNYLQTQSISVTQQLGAHLLDRLARLMREMEKTGRLDRAIEFLPDNDHLAERFKEGIGFTRPEIAVLLAYAKLVLYGELVASDLPDDACAAGELMRYFPEPLRERFTEEISRHRLRREIVATVVTNDLVNRVGITFVHEVKEKTGMPSEEIARAYLVSREIFGIRDLWREIESLDNAAPAAVQAALLAECGRLIEHSTVWFLRLGGPLDVSRLAETYAGGVRELQELLPDVVQDESSLNLQVRRKKFERQGAPAPLADRIARLGLLAPACDIVRFATAAGVAIERAARMYFSIGARFGFDWFRRAASGLPSDTAWEKLAVTSLVDDLYANQAELTRRVLDATTERQEPDAAIEAWASARRSLVARSQQLLAELQSMQSLDLAMLAVASRQLKSMSL